MVKSLKSLNMKMHALFLHLYHEDTNKALARKAVGFISGQISGQISEEHETETGTLPG